MDEQFVNFVRRKLRELGVGYSQFADQVGISRSGLYKILGGNGSGMLVSTLLSMSHALKVHPSSMLRMLAPDRRLARQEDSPSFIGDLSLPDYSPVMPGEKFTKTWVSQNNTDVAWQNCRLICLDSNLRIVRELSDGAARVLLWVCGRPIDLSQFLRPPPDKMLNYRSNSRRRIRLGP